MRSQPPAFFRSSTDLSVRKPINILRLQCRPPRPPTIGSGGSVGASPFQGEPPSTSSVTPSGQHPLASANGWPLDASASGVSRYQNTSSHRALPLTLSQIQCRQHCDNGDDDQQFNKSEALRVTPRMRQTRNCISGHPVSSSLCECVQVRRRERTKAKTEVWQNLCCGDCDHSEDKTRLNGCLGFQRSHK